MFLRLSKQASVELAILALALFLRIWMIEVKPAHFDEGINGWFADRMTETGFYRYDPINYHGPLHFYGVFLSQTLFGRELWALRLPAILASMLCVWAMLRFGSFFGSTVARLAALAMAVSPAYVFYGRYSIHESWQVLFCILLLQAILRLWRDGGRWDLFLAIGSITGLILTKETYILHVGCFVLAAGVLWLWQKVVPSRPVLPFARRQWKREDVLQALGIAALVIVFFYSGTFRDFPAIAGLWQTFAAWFQTGVHADGHEKTTYDLIGPLNWYWVALMARYEWPALLGLLACVRYILPSDARLRYVAIAAGGTLLAYSIIPYKTPWCIISILWPFYLVGAALAEEAARWIGHRVVVMALALSPVAASVVASLNLNFHNYTDDREPYVYVQTYTDINFFTVPLLKAAEADPQNYDLAGVIALESDYPLPWILGDFTRIGYHSKESPPADWNAAFVVIETAREAEIEPFLREPYFKRRFRLRSAQEECTAYLLASKFSDFIPGQPEFRPAR